MTIREAKFGKHRRLPVHATTVTALRDYAEARAQLCSRPRGPSFFVSTRGTRLIYHCVHTTFAQLLTRAGITGSAGASAPTIHGLRHSFAVATLRDWYRAGVDVAARLPALSAYMGHAHRRPRTGTSPPPRTCSPWRRNAWNGRRRAAVSALAPTLEAFFTDRLLTQRQVSPRTVAAYRDTLRLLLGFAQQRTGTPPCRLDLADLDADLIAAFLTHLERDRRNGVRTRNARLAGIHSLSATRRCATPSTPTRSPGCWPSRPTLQPHAGLLPQPGRGGRAARRARPVDLARTPRSRLAGPGRPDRAASQRTHRAHHRGLTSATPQHQVPREGPQGTRHPADPADRRGAARLDAGAHRHRHRPGVPYQARPSAQRRRDPVAPRQTRNTATDPCPSLRQDRVAARLRHTCAVNLLRAGVDIATIALWLGHSAFKPPRSTSMPTSRSRNARYSAPRLPTSHRVATGRPTRCWPSSKR